MEELMRDIRVCQNRAQPDLKKAGFFREFDK